MSDLGTVSILVDVRGQPVVKELATDLNNVAAAETKVSAATQKVMEDFRRTREILANVKKATDDTSASFQRFSAKELQQASQRMNGFERTLANTRRGMGDMGMATQQVGYQVGDFLVQVQSGTNWMVAFGQQATQLVGIMPSFAGSLGMSVGSMIALSSGLGIAIPLVTALGAYFMRTGEDAKNGSGGVSTFTEVVKELTSEIQKNQEAFLKLKFDTESSGVANASQQMEDLRKKIPEVRAELDAFYMATAQAGGISLGALFGDEGDELEANLKTLEDQLFTLEAQAEAQRMLNGHLSTAKGIQAAAAAEKWAELQAAKELEAATANALQVYAKTRAEGEALADAASKAGVSAAQLSHLDFSNIATASTYALQLAGNLGISLDTANKLAALGPQGIGGNDPSGKVYGGRGAAPTQGQIVEQRLAGSIGYFTPPKPGKTKRGGSGAGVTSVENKMEEIYKYLEQDKYLIEQEDIAYKQRQETLESSLQKKIITLEEYNQLEKDLKIRHEADLSAIEQRSWDGRLAEASGFFGALASVVQGGGSKANKAYAAVAAVESTIDAYRAAIKAAAEAKTPWGRVGAYLSVLGTLMKGVSAIKSAGGSGGGGGGSVGSATVTSGASAPAPQTVFINSLEPDGLYSGQALINLFDAFYDENDKRGKVFVVAR